MCGWHGRGNDHGRGWWAVESRTSARGRRGHREGVSDVGAYSSAGHGVAILSGSTHVERSRALASPGSLRWPQKLLVKSQSLGDEATVATGTAPGGATRLATVASKASAKSPEARQRNGDVWRLSPKLWRLVAELLARTTRRRQSSGVLAIVAEARRLVARRCETSLGERRQTGRQRAIFYPSSGA